MRKPSRSAGWCGPQALAPRTRPADRRSVFGLTGEPAVPGRPRPRPGMAGRSACPNPPPVAIAAPARGSPLPLRRICPARPGRALQAASRTRPHIAKGGEPSCGQIRHAKADRHPNGPRHDALTDMRPRRGLALRDSSRRIWAARGRCGEARGAGRCSRPKPRAAVPPGPRLEP